MIFHKKGMSEFTRIILALVVVVILVILLNNQVKGGTKIVKCVESGGTCQDIGTCSEDQVPYPAVDCGTANTNNANPVKDVTTAVKDPKNPVAAPASAKECCLNKNSKAVAAVQDKACAAASVQAGKTTCGGSGESYVCDGNGFCISRCEFCAKNGMNPQFSDVCKYTINNRDISWNGNYICGCSQDECKLLSNSDPPTCLMGTGKGYCFNEAYCCYK
jgi:hypothetical protein